MIENDEYVVILQKLIENESKNCSKEKQNTQFFEIKNHDLMNNVSKKSFENIFDQKSSKQNDLFKILFVNTFQLNFSIFIQREIECFDNNDQNI